MNGALPRIALVGPMGIGKTTALRSLCGDVMASSDVPNLDRAAHSKAFTTVGAEFGEIDLGDGEHVQVCGCPGQDRFDFVRQWILSVSMGVFIMADVARPSAVGETLDLLAEMAVQPDPPLALVLSARPVTPAQIEAFGLALSASPHGVVPILEADPRDRGQLLEAVGVLASMLSLQNEID
ncbi:50S ribosome-binding GTPase [Acidovorax sp. SUPP950]|uniref:GTP-binding protein n=1 Tax=Acidovorax sp. SUPP950 TaxID=511901 RepID=UPI0023C9269D|nr:GTPase [Acidovorax sp. SUPP950]GKS77464.1 50S ribosome-binding GTPase [Acidovorax sp. SUPP950]